MFGEPALQRTKSFNESEFKKNIGEAFADADSKNIGKLRAQKLLQVVQSGLVEATGDQIFKAASHLSRRAFSVSHWAARANLRQEMFSDMKFTKAAHVFVHVEDLFPKKFEINH